MPALTIDIIGLPVSQGSMVSNGTGRGLRHSNEKELKPWRNYVAATIHENLPPDWDPSLPVSITATFRYPRPQGHFGTGKNSNNLLPSAPVHHFVKPDLDKAQRAIGDSLEAGAILRGDQQITQWNVAKRYCIDNEPPGVLLTLIALK